VKCFHKHVLSFEVPSTFLSCNSLNKAVIIFSTLILSLCASYVCFAHSHFIEKPLIRILDDGPLISEVVLSHMKRNSRSCSSGQPFTLWIRALRTSMINRNNMDDSGSP
jgi:hypothetical protein